MLPLQLLLALFQAAQQAREFVAGLQVAQVFGIGRRNIDGDVRRMGIGFFQAQQIVVGSIFQGGNGVFADIDAEHALKAAALDIGDHAVDAVVVETHAVDYRQLLGRAKQARFGIACLRLGGNGADFDKAETERRQRVDILAVFVQPRRQPHRIGQIQPHQFGRRGLGIDGGQQPQAVGALQLAEGEVVGVFGVHGKQKRAQQAVHKRTSVKIGKGADSTRKAARFGLSGCLKTPFARRRQANQGDMEYSPHPLYNRGFSLQEPPHHAAHLSARPPPLSRTHR